MKYLIIVDDEEKAHKAHLWSYRNYPHIMKDLKVRPRGTIHTVAKVRCPDGMPNCRNCGDPEFKESCKEKGHCPYCGIRHGIAPDSVIKANGYRLEPVNGN